MMKIDFHVHITPPDIIDNWEKYAKKEPYFALLSNSKNNKFAKAEDIIDMLEKENFDKAVVFGFAFKDIGLCRYVNDYVAHKVKEFSNKLTGFAVVPSCGAGASKEIERCYNLGLRGVGELFPQGQGINLDNKKETKYIGGSCFEMGIPLLLHTNEPVGHNYPGKTDFPARQLETFISNNPDLKIILAHFGGGLFLYEAMKEIKEKFKNVYYDTAASVFLYDYKIYSAVMALGLCEKLIFGSDFPLLYPSRYMEDLKKCGFSDNETQLVLGKNAQKLLGSF